MRLYFRDICIGLIALPIGFFLLWAGNMNLLDLLVLLLLIALPMGLCLVAVKDRQKPDFDRW
ncbi:MAG TPA: hypothetical protein V6C52_01590 [Coleofasciculaceae cyanobacterium]|jgi:hypothetical protein